MEVNQIRSFRNATPFKPFTLLLDDGREFFVEEPYYMGISPNQDLLLVVSRERTAWFSPQSVAEVKFNGSSNAN